MVQGRGVKVAVVGLGKLGLPLAAQFALKGNRVLGIDRNSSVVSQVNRGLEPFPGELGLADALLDCTENGSLVATTSFEFGVSQAQVIIVVVPLLVDEKGGPDFELIDSATEEIAQHLKPGALVVYETTLPIGTTRGRLKPLLERHSGLKEGQEFDLVFSPERVLTGRVFEDLRKYPKLVGGLSSNGIARAIDFYEAVLDFDVRADLERPNGVWDLGSAEAAEMAKLAETTYRDVNIALANQFAMHAENLGIDVSAVIRACNSQPFSNIHTPGISVGGHCIPVYPRLYMSTDISAGVVNAARELNSSMPEAAIQRITREGGRISGRNALILGVTYRPGVKEDAFSGAHALRTLLLKESARVQALDPFYSDQELEDSGFEACKDFSDVEVIILHTAHPEFLNLNSGDFPQLSLVYDGRNFLDRERWRGVKFLTIGVG